MRRKLAQQPFEQKVRNVGQLVELAARLKAERAEDAADIAWLKKARKKPMHFRPLRDVLAVSRNATPPDPIPQWRSS